MKELERMRVLKSNEKGVGGLGDKIAYIKITLFIVFADEGYGLDWVREWICDEKERKCEWKGNFDRVRARLELNKIYTGGVEL